MNDWLSRCTITHTTLADGPEAAKGTVVVIDVLRAFTVAPLAIAWGAEEVRCVATVEEALAIKAEAPDTRLAMGEQDAGMNVEGFDLNNSPTQLKRLDINGKVIAHRTSHGTQGLVMAMPGADRVLAASFVNAAATARAIAAAEPTHLTFLNTGATTWDGDEDEALADYVGAVLASDDVDPAPFLERVVSSETGQRFNGDTPTLPPSDLRHALELDAVDFALLATQVNGHIALTPMAADA